MMPTMKKLYCLMITFVMTIAVANAQKKEVYADLLLSKPMMEAAHGKHVRLLDNICITPKRLLVMASADSLYFLGYKGCLSYAPKDKHITAFTVVGGAIFYANENRLMRIGEGSEDELVGELPFAPAKLWGGDHVVYASVQNGSKYDVYLFTADKVQQQRRLLEVSAPVVSVLELGANIHVVTSSELLVVNSKNGMFLKTPLDGGLLKNIRSALIDRTTNWLYLTCDGGLFGILPEGLQKICSDSGILCYDKEGFVLFDASQQSVMRLRRNLLKPQQKEVVIEIK